MKRFINKLPKSKVFKEFMGRFSKIVLEHEGSILTGGTITFTAAGIAITYRNSPKIHEIIFDARNTLRDMDDPNQKQKVVKAALKELAPLITPIVVFFAGSTTCAVVNQKKHEAKIATLTAALSLAQTTIADYDLFKEEVQKEVGEEKYREIKDRVTESQIESRMPANCHVEMGDQLCYIPDFDIFFSSTEDRIKAAFDRVNNVLYRNGNDGLGYGNESLRGNEIVTWADLLRELKVPNTPLIADELGWEGERVKYISYWIGSGARNGIPYLAIEIETRATAV